MHDILTEISTLRFWVLTIAVGLVVGVTGNLLTDIVKRSYAAVVAAILSPQSNPIQWTIGVAFCIYYFAGFIFCYAISWRLADYLFSSTATELISRVAGVLVIVVVTAIAGAMPLYLISNNRVVLGLCAHPLCIVAITFITGTA